MNGWIPQWYKGFSSIPDHLKDLQPFFLPVPEIEELTLMVDNLHVALDQSNVGTKVASKGGEQEGLQCPSSPPRLHHRSAISTFNCSTSDYGGHWQ